MGEITYKAWTLKHPDHKKLLKQKGNHRILIAFLKIHLSVHLACHYCLYTDDLVLRLPHTSTDSEKRVCLDALRRRIPSQREILRGT